MSEMVDLSELAGSVAALRHEVLSEAAITEARWEGWIARADFVTSAANFAQYLALRRHDLRPLQRQMMLAGLSSLGRAESRVLPTLDAVAGLLSAATGGIPAPVSEAEFFAGEHAISGRTAELMGPLSAHGPVRLMVTLPSQAADDAGFLRRLAELGVEAVRINCAHDDAAAWGRMIAHVKAAGDATGWRMKVAMDLAGPKIRTGAFRDDKPLKRVETGDPLGLCLPGQLDAAPEGWAAVECTLPEALAAVAPGQRILIDDGKLLTQVTVAEPWGARLAVLNAPEGKGYKLKAEKGINFPETDFSIPALTDEDCAALPFIAAHADALNFSFVQGHEDIAMLQDALRGLRPDDWQRLGLVLKIETDRAVRNLPDMIVRAAGQQPTAVMIARGDLAVEIGFARLAEMQEEILWLCEAAQVPAIWATQVLESYIKTGVPSRGEMTDAAMAARAECVMLNKGPHVFDAIADLDRLWGRMREHGLKKTAWLRPLKSW